MSASLRRATFSIGPISGRSVSFGVRYLHPDLGGDFRHGSRLPRRRNPQPRAVEGAIGSRSSDTRLGFRRAVAASSRERSRRPPTPRNRETPAARPLLRPARVRPQILRARRHPKPVPRRRVGKEWPLIPHHVQSRHEHRARSANARIRRARLARRRSPQRRSYGSSADHERKRARERRTSTTKDRTGRRPCTYRPAGAAAPDPRSRPRWPRSPPTLHA